MFSSAKGTLFDITTGTPIKETRLQSISIGSLSGAECEDQNPYATFEAEGELTCYSIDIEE